MTEPTTTSRPHPPTDRSRQRANLTVGAAVFAFGAFMVGMAYAAVPLYDLFCRVTGYGGTTQVSDGAPGQVSDRQIRIRFNADTAPGLPWDFKPRTRSVMVNVGQEGLIFYTAHNPTDSPSQGTALYNVTPQKVGGYFAKVQCFCFEEQILAGGESMEMPVQFYVDPAILQDPEMDDVRTITLSYTFFPGTGPEG